MHGEAGNSLLTQPSGTSVTATVKAGIFLGSTPVALGEADGSAEGGLYKKTANIEEALWRKRLKSGTKIADMDKMMKRVINSSYVGKL